MRAKATETAGNGNSIEITTWREYGDDNDTLTVAVYPPGESDPMADIARDAGLEIGDGRGQCFSIAGESITDGQVMESGGRKYRVFITEVA